MIHNLISSIGRYTYGFEHISVASWDDNQTIKIGAFCSIANNIKIYLGGNHRPDWVTTYPFGHLYQHIFNNIEGAPSSSNGDVIIGNDVWIGANATIMSGVIIGDGAVIANNAHVVKNVDPYTIVGGNPAKPIRKRFDDETIEKLLKLKWWDFEDSEINKITSILCSDNLNQLFELYKHKLE